MIQGAYVSRIQPYQADQPRSSQLLGLCHHGLAQDRHPAPRLLLHLRVKGRQAQRDEIQEVSISITPENVTSAFNQARMFRLAANITASLLQENGRQSERGPWRR